MADLCTYCGHYLDSLTFYEKALYYSKDMISSETARVWRGRAKVYGFIGNYEEAIFSYEQVIKLQNHLKKDYIQICDMYNCLSNVYEVLKLYEDAKFCYTKFLTIMANNQDKQHRLIGAVYYYLRRIYSERKKYGKALTNFTKALN